MGNIVHVKPNNQTHQNKRVKLVDFSTLTKGELLALDRKWSLDAMKLEYRLEAAVRQNKPKNDVQYLQDSANKLWRRVRALNKHLIKN